MKQQFQLQDLNISEVPVRTKISFDGRADDTNPFGGWLYSITFIPPVHPCLASLCKVGDQKDGTTKIGFSYSKHAARHLSCSIGEANLSKLEICKFLDSALPFLDRSQMYEGDFIEAIEELDGCSCGDDDNQHRERVQSFKHLVELCVDMWVALDWGIEPHINTNQE